MPTPPTRKNSRRLKPSQVLPDFPGIDNISQLLVWRQRDFDTWSRGWVGRVTPCAPFGRSLAGCGAHGVTRPTKLRGLFVTALAVKQKCRAIEQSPGQILGCFQTLAVFGEIDRGNLLGRRRSIDDGQVNPCDDFGVIGFRSDDFFEAIVGRVQRFSDKSAVNQVQGMRQTEITAAFTFAGRLAAWAAK